jgi:hypothetical protein
MLDRVKNHRTGFTVAENEFVKQTAMDRTRNEGVVKYIKTDVILTEISKYKTSWI